LAEGLDIFRLEAIATGGDNPIRQLILYENNFGLMDVWNLAQKCCDSFG
jgi:hypothetical protein